MFSAERWNPTLSFFFAEMGVGRIQGLKESG